LRRVIVVFFLLLVSLNGANLKYVIDGGIFGTLANIDIDYHVGKSSYSVAVEIRLAGLAKLKAKRIIDHRVSKGFIKNGKYYSQYYKVEKRYRDNKKVQRVYSFNYRKKVVTKHYTVWQNGKKLIDTKTKLPYFSTNDLLNLYHNIVNYSRIGKNGTYYMTAVGAENDGGKVKFSISPKKIKMHINNSNFSKGKGVLTFDIDSSGIANLGTVDGIRILGSAKLKQIK